MDGILVGVVVGTTLGSDEGGTLGGDEGVDVADALDLFNLLNFDFDMYRLISYLFNFLPFAPLLVDKAFNDLDSSLASFSRRTPGTCPNKGTPSVVTSSAFPATSTQSEQYIPSTATIRDTSDPARC